MGVIFQKGIFFNQFVDPVVSFGFDPRVLNHGMETVGEGLVAVASGFKEKDGGEQVRLIEGL
jgi:hypothetical protein